MICLFMYGRKKEFAKFEEFYNSSRLEFLVLYGRRTANMFLYRFHSSTANKVRSKSILI